MYRWLALVVVLVLLGGVLVGCAAGAGKTVTAADAGKSIEVKTGQALNIVLEGNPTTGYIWQVAKIDNAVLKQNGDYEFKADSNLTGAGGIPAGTQSAERFARGPGGPTSRQLITAGRWPPWRP